MMKKGYRNPTGFRWWVKVAKSRLIGQGLTKKDGKKVRKITMDIKDFKVGQTVYVELIGNAKRGRCSEELIEEWEVAKVGRKYVHAQKKGSIFPVVFEKNEYDGNFVEKTDISVDYILYASKSEIEEKFEREKLYSEIRDTFREYGNCPSKLSLEQLRKIKAIIEDLSISERRGYFEGYNKAIDDFEEKLIDTFFLDGKILDIIGKTAEQLKSN